MVLRLRVMNSHFLREAVQTIRPGGLRMVIFSWNRDYLAVESVLIIGRTPISLLMLNSDSFSFYNSTDRHFNATVKSEELQSVFHAAHDSDPIEFYQSFRHNGTNQLGFLNARFNRPVTTTGVFRNTSIISMKIFGMSAEGNIRATDILHYPSPNIPLVPMNLFGANDFMDALHTPGPIVFYTAQGRRTEVIMNIPGGDHGVISSREVGEIEPILVPFDLRRVDLQPSAALSNEVSLFKRDEQVALIWFGLDQTRTHLDGHIIHCLH